MTITQQVKQILSDALALDLRHTKLDSNTPLLGNFPELDSMGVINVITSLEDFFGIVVEDDEINADTFATLKSLTVFVEHKLNP
jgi:acyl carrier protein